MYTLLWILLLVVGFIWVMGSLLFGFVWWATYDPKVPPQRTRKDFWLDLAAVLGWPLLISFGVLDVYLDRYRNKTE
jgi:hypothetical protein